MANRFPLIFNSGAGQIQELAASDNLDLTSSNLVNAGILFTSSGSQTAPSISIGNGTTYPPGLYSPGTDQLAVATNGTGKVLVDTNGTILVNTTIQATSNGGLNIENTGAGTFTSPLALLNRGTTNNTGVSLSFRGLSAASAETDYAYLRMLATDTTSRHGRIEFWTANSGTVTEKLCITRDGLVGIGNSGPNAKLHITGGASLTGGEANLAVTSSTTASVPATISSLVSNATLQIFAGGLEGDSFRGGQIDLKAGNAASDAGTILFRTGTGTGGTSQTEKARLDASGRLLVGTSSVINNAYGGTSGLFQVSKDDFLPIGFFSFTSTAADGYCPYLELHRARGTKASPTIVSSGDELGEINFYGYDGSAFRRGAYIRSYVDAAPVSDDMPSRLTFYTSANGSATPTERMSITSAGLVGIGTTNPTSKLHVIGDALVSGIITATTFQSTSDINLKENIKTVNNSLNIVSQLRGVTFDWKNTHQASIGVIAQEVEQILPELVSGGGNKTVNYNGIIGILVEAIKEQEVRIEKLENKLNVQ